MFGTRFSQCKKWKSQKAYPPTFIWNVFECFSLSTSWKILFVDSLMCIQRLHWFFWTIGNPAFIGFVSMIIEKQLIFSWSLTFCGSSLWVLDAFPFSDSIERFCAIHSWCNTWFFLTFWAWQSLRRVFWQYRSHNFFLWLGIRR